MLPGDFIAMRMTGDIVTTVSGLSEGIFWDFRNNSVSEDLMSYFGFSKELVPDIRPTFGVQGELLGSVASELGLKKGTPVTYRAGDQPNNALSLNVLNPGEIAATGGTSGVVYGVNGKVNYDTLSRVNTFAHVNHSADRTRLGVLLCINGVGILNSWGEAECGPGRYKLSCFERAGGDCSDRFGGPLDSAFRERCGAYVTEQAGGLLHSRAEFQHS